MELGVSEFCCARILLETFLGVPGNRCEVPRATEAACWWHVCSFLEGGVRVSQEWLFSALPTSWPTAGLAGHPLLQWPL